MEPSDWVMCAVIVAILGAGLMVLINYVFSKDSPWKYWRLPAAMLGLLAFCSPAEAAIVYVTSAHNSGTDTQVSATISPVAGDTLVVFVSVAAGSIASGNVTDNKGTIYTLQITKVDTLTTGTLAVYTAVDVVAGVSSVTFSHLTSLLNTICVEEYSGCDGVGNTASANGTNTTPSVSVTLGTANNYIACGCEASGVAITSYAASAGNLRTSDVATALTGAAGDRTSASTGSLTWTVSISATSVASWAAAGVELVVGVDPIIMLPSPNIRQWCFSGDKGAYGKRLTTAVDNWAVFLRVYWNGPIGIGTANTGKDQSLFYNGNAGTDGWGVYIAATIQLSGHYQNVSGLAGGVAAVTSNVGPTLNVGAWNTIIISREATTWLLRVNGSAYTFNNSPTATPGSPSNVAFVGGDGTGSNFNGIIDTVGVWARSGSAPLSAGDKTSLEGGSDPSTIATSFLLASHKITGNTINTESDTSGNGNPLTIAGTIIFKSVGASRAAIQRGN